MDVAGNVRDEEKKSETNPQNDPDREKMSETDPQNDPDNDISEEELALDLL